MSAVWTKSLYMVAGMLLIGLVSLGGCSKNNVVANTSGTEASLAGESKSLQGFSKNPTEEVIKAPASIAVAKADQSAVVAGQRALADIYFAFDKWALTDEGKKHLTQNAEALKQVPTVKLIIEGHCDERGSREYNLVLGEKRAQETRRYLSALGITNPVSVTSYGKERPICTGRDESCYWKNRRAHLVLETSNGK